MANFNDIPKNELPSLVDEVMLTLISSAVNICDQAKKDINHYNDEILINMINYHQAFIYHLMEKWEMKAAVGVLFSNFQTQFLDEIIKRQVTILYEQKEKDKESLLSAKELEHLFNKE